MKNFLTNYKEVLLLSVIVFILSLSGLWMTGGLTNKIYPVTADDDVYYLARVNTVYNGYLNIGSPYYIEHALDEAPAFIAPDILSSFPLFLGFSMNHTVVFNFIFWSEVFSLLLWLILLKLGFSKKMGMVGALFVYLQVYWMIMRPVILQVVWPVFLLFILGVILFEKDRKDKLGFVLIIISTALSFYFYSFLSQLIVVILILLILYLLYEEDKQKMWRVFFAGLLAFVLVIPELINQYKHLLDPVYWETFERLGLVKSHWPTIYQYNYSRWIFFTIPAWFLLRRKIHAEKIKDVFIYMFGVGLIILIWSNLITGNDYYLGTHVGLFITLYIAVAVVLLTHLLFIGRAEFLKNTWWVKVIISLLLFALFANVTSNFQRSLPWREVFRKDLIKYEKVAGVLSWIKSSGEKNKVVLADDTLAMYIGMYTNFYSVFAKFGQLGMMRTDEAIDRYLVSRSLQKIITKEQIVNEKILYSGLGDGTRLDSLNKKNRDCRNYRLDVFVGMFCESQLSIVEYKGDAYWNNLLAGWSLNKKNIVNKLSEYKVTYIAWPKDRIEEVDLSKLFLKVVYEDQYYIVYEIIKK